MIKRLGKIIIHARMIIKFFRQSDCLNHANHVARIAIGLRVEDVEEMPAGVIYEDSVTHSGYIVSVAHGDFPLVRNRLF